MKFYKIGLLSVAIPLHFAGAVESVGLQEQTESNRSAAAAEMNYFFENPLKLSPFLKMAGYSFNLSASPESSNKTSAAPIAYRPAAGPSLGLRAEYAGFGVSVDESLAQLVPESGQSSYPARGSSQDYRASYEYALWSVQGNYQDYSGFVPGEDDPQTSKNYRGDIQASHLRFSLSHAIGAVGAEGVAFKSFFDHLESLPSHWCMDYVGEVFYDTASLHGATPLYTLSPTDNLLGAQTRTLGAAAGATALLSFEKNYISGLFLLGPGFQMQNADYSTGSRSSAGAAVGVDLKIKYMHIDRRMEYGAVISVESLSGQLGATELTASGFELLASLGVKI